MTFDAAQKEVLAGIFGMLVERRKEIIEDISRIPDCDNSIGITLTLLEIKRIRMSEVERIILAIGEMHEDDLDDEQKDTIACILSSIELRKQEAE